MVYNSLALAANLPFTMLSQHLWQALETVRSGQRVVLPSCCRYLRQDIEPFRRELRSLDRVETIRCTVSAGDMRLV